MATISLTVDNTLAANIGTAFAELYPEGYAAFPDPQAGTKQAAFVKHKIKQFIIREYSRHKANADRVTLDTAREAYVTDAEGKIT